MSQQGLLNTKAHPQYPADAFFVLTVADTTGFVVGEKITGATTGATAKVSGVVSATVLRIKGMKPGTNHNFCGANGSTAENITGEESTTVASATGLSLKNQRARIVSGSKTLVDEDKYVLTDAGFVIDPSVRTGLRDSYPATVVSAVRMAMSKQQNTDTTVAPSYGATAFTLIGGKLRKAATQTISKAAAGILRISIKLNEAVTLSLGATQFKYVLTFFDDQTKDAVYNATASDSHTLVFDYRMDGTENTGAMVSAAYTVGNTTITDKGGAAFTLADVDPVVTGWTIAA